MKFFFSKGILNKNNIKYAHYQFKDLLVSDCQCCDLHTYVLRLQERWLDDIEEWHSLVSAFMSKNNRWWWIMPSSRLISWHPPVFKPLLFAVAIIDYCRENSIDELYLIDCPTEVSEYIKEISPDSMVTHDGLAQPNKKNKYFSYYFTQGVCSVLSQLLRLFLKKIFSGKSKKIDKKQTIIFSYLLDINNFASKGDHYYGRMFSTFSLDFNGSLLWVYFPYFDSGKDVFEKHFNNIGQEVIFLIDLVCYVDLIKIFFICIGIICNKASFGILPITIGKYKSILCAQSFFDNRINRRLPVMELAVYFGMRRLLSASRAKKIIFPYEEKPVDRAIIMAARSFEKPVETIAFAHAVYNPGHLYLRQRKQSDSNSPKPDIVMAPGPSVAQWLANWAKIDRARIKTVGSPRYQDNRLRFEAIDTFGRKLKVLFLVGLGHEINMLARHIEITPELFDDCDLWIRKHPNDWQQEQDEAILRLQKILPAFRFQAASLDNQLRWCDIVVYDATSAGVEAMLWGRLAIHVDLSDVLTYNCILGKGKISDIYHCANSKELRSVIMKIKSMSGQEYLEVLRKQYLFASQVYSAVDLRVLENIATSTMV